MRSRAQAGGGVSSKAAHEKGGRSREHTGGSAPHRPGALQTRGTALDDGVISAPLLLLLRVQPHSKGGQDHVHTSPCYSYSGRCEGRAERASLWAVQATRMDGAGWRDGGGSTVF